LLADSRVDPTVNDNEAINEAIINSYPEVVKLLLADSRVASSYKPISKFVIG